MLLHSVDVLAVLVTSSAHVPENRRELVLDERVIGLEHAFVARVAVSLPVVEPLLNRLRQDAARAEADASLVDDRLDSIHKPDPTA